MSLKKTVIKYIITGLHMFKIPIINIIPIGDIEIKITFPNINDNNTWSISTNNKITITQKCIFNTNDVNLIINETILGTKDEFYNNGTIIITGECTIEESHYMYYDQ